MSAATAPAGVNRKAVLVAAAAAAAAALSLLWVGEATSRDTNNWLIWARQLSLGHSLDFTGGVPSWKPLPVIVTLPFARLSPSASNLFWLWLVRFSWLMCSGMLAAIVLPRFGRVAAAVAAALPLALPVWFAYALMGDSEPVATALALGALIATQRLKPRLAFSLLTAAGLLRPELWLLLAALTVWQWRRDRNSALLNIGVSAAVLFVGWSLIPALAGGGWTQSASRAATRLLVANQSDGFFTLLPMRAWLLVAVGAIGVWLRRDGALAAVGIASLGLGAEVELMSWFGFSGLDRYVMPGIIGLCAFGGAGVGTLLGFCRPEWAKWTVGSLACLLVAGLVWSSFPLDRDNTSERRAEGLSAQRAEKAFELSGGTSRFSNCLPLVTNGYWSVILARMTGLPNRDVTNNGVAPAVVLRPLKLDSYKNGPVVAERGIKPVIVGYQRPDWAVILYPGCESHDQS